jgi:hypothetical protein
MAEKFNYPETMLDAHEMLVEFGMDAVLRRTGFPDRPCVVAMIVYSPRDKAAELANPVDRSVIMSALTPEIQAMPPDNEQDQLVTFVQPPTNPPVENEVLPFTCPVKPTAPAGITVLYEFTVRR